MKFKKIAAALTMIAGVGIMSAVAVNAEQDIVTVSVDNKMVEFDQNPIIVDGHTMVPIRAVFEKAGATVDWNQGNQTAAIALGNYVVTIKYGDNCIYKNGNRIDIEAPAISVNDRILIPVRAIAEAMDFAVTWDGHHSLVLVSTTGKPYRPYAFRKTGFRTLEDASEFYTRSGNTSIDLDNDGKPEELEFNTAEDFSVLAKPVLSINGMNYTYGLTSISNAYSMAVVDLDVNDNTKEIVITENGDVRNAYFYHYDNGILKPIKNSDGTPVTISYASQLFISGENLIINDISGACFVDIMVTGGVYQYVGDEDLNKCNIVLRPMSSIEAIFGRNLYNTYPDNMVYKIIYTSSYTPGSYKNVNEVGTITSSQLDHFQILDGYCDKENPTYLELYIKMSDGTTAVIKPYSI